MADDLTMQDIIRLVSYLHSELESREVVIDKLKRHIMDSSCPSVNESTNPLRALARDSFLYGEILEPSTPTDTRVHRLEELANSQHEALCKMKERLHELEVQYTEARQRLEKYETTEDSVANTQSRQILQAEHDRLKLQVQNEQLKNNQLSDDMKRLLVTWYDQKLLINKQKQVAVHVIKERRHLLNELTRHKQKIEKLESALRLQKEHCTCKASRLKIANQDGNTGHLVATTGVSDDQFQPPKDGYTSTSDLNVALKSDRSPADSGKLSTEFTPSATATFSTSSKSAESVSSPLYIARAKPDPPARRCSELKATADVQPTNATFTVKSTTSGTTTALQSGPSLSVTVPVTDCDQAKHPFEPRSSTPSPPPPPPPVQLHFPYPGMSNHSSATRLSDMAPQLSGSVRANLHNTPFHHSDKSRLQPSRPHTSQSIPVCKFNYTSNLTTRPISPQSVGSVGPNPRRPCVPDTSFLRLHRASASVAVGSPSVNSSAGLSIGHHLPAYCSTRSVTPGSVSPNSLSSSRAPTSASASDFTNVTSPGGHICINGK